MPSYTIYYNSNGGVGGIPSTTILAGEKTNIAYNNNRFTRANYVFWGWCTVKVNNNTGKCDGGTAYNEGKQVKAPADGGSLTLYAIWVPYSIEIIRGSAYVDGNGNRICTTDWTDENYAYPAKMDVEAPDAYYWGQYYFSRGVTNHPPYGLHAGSVGGGDIKNGFYTEVSAKVKALRDDKGDASFQFFVYQPPYSTGEVDFLDLQQNFRDGETKTISFKDITVKSISTILSVGNVDGKSSCISILSATISNPKKR